MKPILTTLLLLTALPCFAQDQTPASAPNRSPADGPFTPQAIVPGGIILPLYAPTSPLLKTERLHESENYNSATGGKGPITNVINIHNPSLEVHLVGKDQPNTGTADIVVYSATAGGVTASVAAARQGATVVLVEPGHHVGGMLSGGLGHSDVGGQPQIIGGLAREVYERMARRYGSPDASKAFDFEPHVAEETLREMLREAGVRVVFGERVETVEKADQRLVAMTTQSGNRYEARVFIDAGYEGDLMAKAGVRYTVGREGKAQYGEWLAGRMELLPGQHRHVRLQYRHLRGAVGLGARVPFSESGG